VIYVVDGTTRDIGDKQGSKCNPLGTSPLSLKSESTKPIFVSQARTAPDEERRSISISAWQPVIESMAPKFKPAERRYLKTEERLFSWSLSTYSETFIKPSPHHCRIKFATRSPH
jgi:hypothetical protein